MIRVVKPFYRSRWIVDRGLQFNLVTRMVIFVLFVFCVLSAVLFAPLAREIGPTEDSASRESVATLLGMLGRVWPVVILCLGVAMVSAVFVSHRIAGPLVRVKRILRFVTEGHFPRRLETRPHDYFKEEVDVLNEMVAGVSSRVAEVAQASGEMRCIIARFEESLDGGTDHDLREAFSQIAEKADALDVLLDEFSWEPGARPGVQSQDSPVAERMLDGAV